MHWSDKVMELGACDVDWERTQPSAEAAWQRCERGDRMLWLLGRLSGPPDSKARKKLVLCACDCAELGYKDESLETQAVIDKCLWTTRDWARDGDSTLDDVRRTATAAFDYAAADAAYAAVNAAYAAVHAAVHAAIHAAHAAYAAYAAAVDATCTEIFSQAADIVRRHYPEPPQEIR